jgi:hypothetical protein
VPTQPRAAKDATQIMASQVQSLRVAFMANFLSERRGYKKIGC